MSSYCTKHKLPQCSSFWGYLTLFCYWVYITCWNQTWILHRKWVLMLWQFYKSHFIANTKTLVRMGDVRQLPCSGAQKYNTKCTHPGWHLRYVHPSTSVFLCHICAPQHYCILLSHMCTPTLLYSCVTYVHPNTSVFLCHICAPQHFCILVSHMCTPALLYSCVTYVHPNTSVFLCHIHFQYIFSINFCAIYLHFSTSPMIDVASHNYILCYVCACNSVQLCGYISERAEFPDAFLTEV